MPVLMESMFQELEFEQFAHPLTSKAAYRACIGPYEVELALLTNRWFQQSWMVSGIVNSGRTIAAIEAELPLEMDTREQAIALLSHFVGQHIPEDFKPAWLRIGERMTSHLPWARNLSNVS